MDYLDGQLKPDQYDKAIEIASSFVLCSNGLKRAEIGRFSEYGFIAEPDVELYKSFDGEMASIPVDITTKGCIDLHTATNTSWSRKRYREAVEFEMIAVLNIYLKSPCKYFLCMTPIQTYYELLISKIEEKSRMRGNSFHINKFAINPSICCVLLTKE